jgi:hypothetical protein
MSSKWRRFEILIPLRFNDGSEVPGELRARAYKELVNQFGAASFETQVIEGQWTHAGTTYNDLHTRLVIDAPDTPANRKWMKAFRDRWRREFRQIELWLVSYSISVE